MKIKVFRNQSILTCFSKYLSKEKTLKLVQGDEVVRRQAVPTHREFQQLSNNKVDTSTTLRQAQCDRVLIKIK